MCINYTRDFLTMTPCRFDSLFFLIVLLLLRCLHYRHFTKYYPSPKHLRTSRRHPHCTSTILVKRYSHRFIFSLLGATASLSTSERTKCKEQEKRPSLKWLAGSYSTMVKRHYYTCMTALVSFICLLGRESSCWKKSAAAVAVEGKKKLFHILKSIVSVYSEVDSEALLFLLNFSDQLFPFQSPSFPQQLSASL